MLLKFSICLLMLTLNDSERDSLNSSKSNVFNDAITLYLNFTPLQMLFSSVAIRYKLHIILQDQTKRKKNGKCFP